MNLLDYKLNGPDRRALPAHLTAQGWSPEGMRRRVRQQMPVGDGSNRAERLRLAYNNRRNPD